MQQATKATPGDILIIDDEPEIVEMLVEALQAE